MTTLSAIALHEAALIASINEATAQLDTIGTDTLATALANLQAAAGRAIARMAVAELSATDALRDVLAFAETLQKPPTSTHQIAQDETIQTEATLEPVKDDGVPVHTLVIAMEEQTVEATKETPSPDVTSAKPACNHEWEMVGSNEVICELCGKVDGVYGPLEEPAKVTPPECQHERRSSHTIDAFPGTVAYRCLDCQAKIWIPIPAEPTPEISLPDVPKPRTPTVKPGRNGKHTKPKKKARR